MNCSIANDLGDISAIFLFLKNVAYFSGLPSLIGSRDDLSTNDIADDLE